MLPFPTANHDHIITVEVHVSGVPALICNECAEELILPEVEQRIWDEFKVIEDSKEFKSLIENQKELLRRTPIKQTMQYFNMIYGCCMIAPSSTTSSSSLIVQV